MKYTLLLTQLCNLACDYCYISQRPQRMTLPTAARVIDFAFSNAPPSEEIEVGFFGGEPLLEFRLIQGITNLIESHPAFDSERVRMSVVTNGTLLRPEIIDFLLAHGITLGISCDGSPDIQDLHRRFHNGGGTFTTVRDAILLAAQRMPHLMVNAVYGPDTLKMLPSTVHYIASLGVRYIYLSPRCGAKWDWFSLQQLPEVYAAVGGIYVRQYLSGSPHFISLIDSKIAAILRGGYQPLERCRMGFGEFAFTPSGNIYPCERLVGTGGHEHCIGDLDNGIDLTKLQSRAAGREAVNLQCKRCSLRDYCMTWCGCTNYLSTGSYNKVDAFLCASERASIQAAFDAFQKLEEAGIGFHDHLSGLTAGNAYFRA